PGVELLSGSESVHLLDALDQPADVQIPTLTIEEQPARFYRFRYESEIEKDSGRVGGLLLGRSSTDGNKSFMRVRVSDINPAVHSQLQLTVCTVSAEENAPHPYYLHGDHCSNGYFQLNKSVTSKDFWDVSFDRLAVIRVTKQKNKNSEMDMEARRNNLPAFLHCKDYATDKLNEIRLVFCLEFTDTNGQNWQLNNPEFSDKISSAKEKKNIEITSLNPVEVPIKGRCMIAIHSSNPTTGIPMRDVKVHFIVTNVDTKQKAVYVRDVDVMKKVTMQQLLFHSSALGQHESEGGSAKYPLPHEPDRNPMIAATSTQAFLNEIVASEVEYCEYSGTVAASDATQVNGRDFLLQAEPQLLSLKELQPPSLTIEEQPVRFYGFRYESQRRNSYELGRLLDGRSSTDGNKSFVRVRVSGIDPAVHSQLQLTVCTVSAEEKAPHPYYLHGDHCSNGYFQLKKSVDASRDSGGEWEITFERLAVICVLRKTRKTSKTAWKPDAEMFLSFQISSMNSRETELSSWSMSMLLKRIWDFSEESAVKLTLLLS
uniref:RHD domain-containing protein n=1 Tax=Macrostomum lignano TaxID=282301 RepID=A0A1I8II91_9PLAT